MKLFFSKTEIGMLQYYYTCRLKCWGVHDLSHATTISMCADGIVNYRWYTKTAVNSIYSDIRLYVQRV